MNEMDYLPNEIRDELETLIEKAVKAAIPAGIHKYRESVAGRKDMTVDVFFVVQETMSKARNVDVLNELPAVPPLPGIGGMYLHKDDDDKTTMYRVENIIYSYRYMNYQSGGRLPEVITEIHVYLREH